METCERNGWFYVFMDLGNGLTYDDRVEIADRAVWAFEQSKKEIELKSHNGHYEGKLRNTGTAVLGTYHGRVYEGTLETELGKTNLSIILNKKIKEWAAGNN